jgi:hypothetical protein
MGEHRQDVAMVGLRRRQIELLEDAGGVLLDRPTVRPRSSTIPAMPRLMPSATGRACAQLRLRRLPPG